MKLKVDLTYWHGLTDGGDPGPPEPDYDLVDVDTGKVLTAQGQLRTYEQVEAYIAARYPDCERWVPPPASPKEAAALARIFELLEAGVELDRVVIRRMLIGQLYQSGCPEETVAKIRAWIARLA